MKILVLNAGSTSVKFKLYEMPAGTVISEGNCQKVGREDAEMKYTAKSCGKKLFTLPIPTHAAAIAKILELLTCGETKVIDSVKEISAAAHRVSAGGIKYTKTVPVDDEVIREVEELAVFAPLHNPAQAGGMRACREVFGEDFPMTVGFDNSFTSTIPPVAHVYAAPYRYYELYDLRKYGYHGLSYEYVVRRYAALAKKELPGTRVVACHLGGGSSLCAIKDGIAVDNTFGLGTGQGMPCGTRAGSFDHTGIGYIMQKENISYEQVEDILHRESGLLGISGISGDEKELEDAAAEGNARAQLALDIMAYDAKKYMGSYAYIMGGLDAVIFTGGIGENSDVIRAMICDGLEELGIVLDRDANIKFNRQEHRISADSSKVDIWLIPTDEEFIIAEDTMEILGRRQ